MSIIRYNLKRHQLQSWKDYIYTLSKDLIDGRFRGPVSPAIFNESDILELLKNNKMESSIYVENIPLFYRLGRMWLADVKKDGGFYNLHVIISIPQIKSTEMYILYQVNQVGLVNGSQCMSLDIPNQVYQKSQSFYELENENNCEVRSGIKLCLGNKENEKESRKAKCLTAEPSKCKTIMEKCQVNFIQTGSGVMVRALNHLKASTQTSPTEYIDIANSSVVKFLSYEKYYQVVADNFIIRSINEPMFAKELELEDPEKWEKYLISEHNQLRRTNVSEISTNLIRQKEIVAEMKSGKMDLGMTKDMTLFNTIATGFTFIAVVIGLYLLYHHCKKRYISKKSTEKIKYSNVSSEEMDPSESKDKDLEAEIGPFDSNQVNDGLRNRASSAPKPYSVDDL